MSEIKLKPCPFCGGEAHVYKCKSSLLDKIFYAIDCDSKECITHTMTADYSTEIEAIKAWNTRKPMDDIMKGIAIGNTEALRKFRIEIGGKSE